MEAHKIIANKLLDGAALSPPASSSPLRRKSIMVQQSNVLSSLSENDDEAERLARRREIDTTPTIAGNTSDKRRSLGLNILGNMPTVQMVERISQCIKLGTENKINLKNAFSLHMIDFMTYMIKKQDVNMANLQMASMSLDVSTKIYGFRVDGIHMEILKMMGGLEKQEKNLENPTDNNAEPMDTEETNNGNEVQTKKKIKKKKVRQQLLTTVESLRTTVEIEKPTLMSMESDSQTSDMLFQATLPNHVGSGVHLHPYNDILVDTVECKEIQNTNAGYSNIVIKDISEMQICPPMFFFDFQNFDASEVLEDAEPEKMNENTFQFDLNASLPQDTRESYAGMNYYDMEDAEVETVDRCVKLPDQVENIVDFRQVLASTVTSKPSEYSFIQKSLNIHWTGPSHWKSTNFRKILGNSKVVEKCHQDPNKKKKEIELRYDHETKESTGAKFLPSKAAKMHIRTAKMEWNEEILTLPPDEHYDIVQASKLYLHTTMFEPPKNIDEMNTTHLSDNVDNYDYKNDNDTSNYCSEANVNINKETEQNNTTFAGGVLTNDCAVATQPLTGTNLVSMPTLTNKTTIAYCGRAKKIDMKQLKHSIWKCLCVDSNTQNMEVDTCINESVQDSNKMNGAKSFKKIYKILPTLLTKNNTEALSFPISFVSLLHLANEKSLQVIASPDMTDLIIKQD